MSDSDQTMEPYPCCFDSDTKKESILTNGIRIHGSSDTLTLFSLFIYNAGRCWRRYKPKYEYGLPAQCISTCSLATTA